MFVQSNYEIQNWAFSFLQLLTEADANFLLQNQGVPLSSVSGFQLPVIQSQLFSIQYIVFSTYHIVFSIVQYHTLEYNANHIYTFKCF